MVSSVENSRKSSLDTLLVCLSLCVPSVYFGGVNSLLLILTCLSVTAVSEYLLMKLICKRNLLSEFSFVSSALTIALLLPSDAPLYVGAAASLFSVAVAVFPFAPVFNTLVDSVPITVAELAKANGKAAGVVTTDQTSGATPSAFSAHALARGQEKDISNDQL